MVLVNPTHITSSISSTYRTTAVKLLKLMVGAKLKAAE